MKEKLSKIIDRLNSFLNDAEGYYSDNDELVEEGCSIVDDLVDLKDSIVHE